MHRPTSHLARLCAVLFFGHEKNTDGSTVGLMILVASVMATFELQNIFCTCTWFSNQSGVGAILALSSFLSQFPHLKELEMSVGYI